MNASIYAGNLQRTGEFRTRGVPLFHEVLWSFVLSSDNSQTDYPNSLLLQDGIVYAGYGDHTCCAIDAQTGELRWRFEIEELAAERRERVYLDWEEVPHRVASLALTATTALVGTNCGIIYGIDAHTGEQLWRLDAAEIDHDHEWDGLCVRYMDVVDNLLLVSIDQEEVNDGAGNIYAIDLVSKTCVWDLVGSTERPLTIADHLLFGVDVLDFRDCIYSATNWQTQREEWCSYSSGVTYGNGVSVIPVFIAMRGCIPFSNNTLYVIGQTEDYQEKDDDKLAFLALNARTGEVRWTCTALDGAFGPDCFVTVGNGLAYVSQAEGLRAIDLETHRLRWSHPSSSQVPAMLADGLLYGCRWDGLVMACDALTGEERWTHQLDGRIDQPCLVEEGIVYVVAGTTLYALH